jgi:hypothetical protein
MPDIELEYNNHIKNKYDSIRKYRVFLELACMIKINEETKISAMADRRTYPFTSDFIYCFMNSDFNLYDILNLGFYDFMLKIDDDVDYKCFYSYKNTYKNKILDKAIHAKVIHQIKYRENCLANKYIGTFSHTKNRIVLTQHGFKIISESGNSCHFSINSGYIRLDSISKNSISNKRNFIIERFGVLKTFVSNIDEFIEIEDVYLKDLVHMYGV